MRKLLLAALLLSAGFAFCESGEEILKGLLDSPPKMKMIPERLQALKSLDEWFSRPDSETFPECVEYYQNAIDRAIHTLQTERPKKGIRIFQLYSSSVIIQGESCVTAIDLDQGPNEDLNKTPEDEGVAFRMTDAQVAALADIIDYSFHTHEHADHVDYEIVRALLERGKTVVAPESLKKLWKDEPWSSKILTPKQTLGEGQIIGKLTVNVLWDHQWNNMEHSSGTPCNAYLIQFPEGVSVCDKGDINCALQYYGWLSILKERGVNIDVMVGSPIYWKGVNLIREIDALTKPLWLPGHNWEFVHRSKGEAIGNISTYSRSYSLLNGLAKSGETSMLSWGEYLDVPKGKSATSGKKAKH